jgi:hypothetical protein
MEASIRRDPDEELVFFEDEGPLAKLRGYTAALNERAEYLTEPFEKRARKASRKTLAILGGIGLGGLCFTTGALVYSHRH